MSHRRPPHTRVACRIASLLRESHTFVTNHEPALAHHCHLEPMVYLDFVRGAVHCMSLDKCIVTRVHDDSIIQSSLTALKTLCSACHPSAPQLLATTDLFTLSTLLLFPECYIVGFMQHVPFSFQLLSFSTMHLRLLHVFSGLGSSFPWRVG